jgi:hypothetical protein
MLHEDGWVEGTHRLGLLGSFFSLVTLFLASPAVVALGIVYGLATGGEGDRVVNERERSVKGGEMGRRYAEREREEKLELWILEEAR